MKEPDKLFRAVEVLREKTEDGKENIFLSVSSETPCLNYIVYERRYQYGNVILSHADGAIDDTYVKDGIVLRDNHEEYGSQKGEVVARAMDVKVEDGKLRAGKIVWSASDRAQILKADVENGVRREMSIEATFSSKDVERIDKGDEEKGVYPTFRVNFRPRARRSLSRDQPRRGDRHETRGPGGHAPDLTNSGSIRRKVRHGQRDTCRNSG